jgi:hypothetical protein
MSDNYFMLDGEKIPMSKETADSLRKQTAKIPMLRVGTFGGDPRLLIKFNKSILEVSKHCRSGEDVLILDSKGRHCNSWNSNTKGGPIPPYSNVKELVWEQ